VVVNHGDGCGVDGVSTVSQFCLVVVTCATFQGIVPDGNAPFFAQVNGSYPCEEMHDHLAHAADARKTSLPSSHLGHHPSAA